MIPTTEVILYAEDNETDAFLFEKAFRRAGIEQRLVIVPSGKAVMDYLAGDGRYADRAIFPMPCLVLLDLNMPGSSGLDVLKWIRATPRVCTLVTVVLSSSNEDADIDRAYIQGANGYLVKPLTLEELVQMAAAIKDYWLVQNRAVKWAKAKDRPQD